MKFEFIAYATPKKVALELLNAISHTDRNGEERQEISRKIGETALNKGNSPTLRQIQPFPTGQTPFNLLKNPILDRLGLKPSTKRKTKVFQG